MFHRRHCELWFWIETNNYFHYQYVGYFLDSLIFLFRECYCTINSFKMDKREFCPRVCEKTATENGPSATGVPALCVTTNSTSSFCWIGRQPRESVVCMGIKSENRKRWERVLCDRMNHDSNVSSFQLKTLTIDAPPSRFAALFLLVSRVWLWWTTQKSPRPVNQD